MKKELLEQKNKTGRLNLTSRSRLVKRDTSSQEKLRINLRMEELDRCRLLQRQRIEADNHSGKTETEEFNRRRDVRLGRLKESSGVLVQSSNLMLQMPLGFKGLRKMSSPWL